MAKTTPKPIRYNAPEWEAITRLQQRTLPKLSVSEIQRRAVRWALPKFLSGEIPISDTVLLRPLKKKKAKA